MSLEQIIDRLDAAKVRLDESKARFDEAVFAMNQAFDNAVICGNPTMFIPDDSAERLANALQEAAER